MAEVQSSMLFFARDDLYEHEKPYQLKYIPDSGVPASNYRVEKREGIKISSMRGREDQFSVEKNGFAVFKMDQAPPYTDFDNPEGIRKYLETVVQSVKTLLGADKVQVFNYAMRKRDPVFPKKALEEDYENYQPATMVHIDTSINDAESTCRRVLDDPTRVSKCQRYQIVNVWKPLRGPLRDWPLALCDLSTVRATDTLETDNVYTNRVVESMQVHYAETQAWYYLQDQQASELLVFQQADSQKGKNSGVPHTSFANPFAGPDELPRESIEVRTLVSYGDVN